MRMSITRACSLLLTLVLIISLAGCGSGIKSTQSQSQGKTTSTDSTGDVDDFNLDGSAAASGTTSKNGTDAQNGKSSVTSGKSNGSTNSTTGGDSSKRDKNSVLIWGDKNDIALQYAIGEYKKKYPNINVLLENGPMNLNITSFKTAVMSGTGPDVYYSDHVYATQLGTEGILADLTPYGANSIKSKFVESTWKANMVDNKVYGLPYCANCVTGFYTKSLITSFGKVPATWEEMKSFGSKLKAQGKYAYTFPKGSGNWQAFNYCFWLWREGGDLLKKDSNGKLRAAFNGDEGVRAVNKLKELFTSGYMTESYDESGNTKIGVFEMGNWKSQFVTGTSPSHVLDLMPALKDGIPAYSGLGLYSYCVPAKAVNPQAAFNFISVLCTNLYCQKKANVSGSTMQLSPLIEAQSLDEYKGANAAVWSKFFKQLANSKFRPGIPGWNELENSISAAVTKAVFEGRDAKEMLDTAANVVNSHLKRVYG